MVQRMSFLALIRAIKWLKTVQLACRIGVSIVHEECRCSAKRCRKRAKRVRKRPKSCAILVQSTP